MAPRALRRASWLSEPLMCARASSSTSWRACEGGPQLASQGHDLCVVEPLGEELLQQGDDVFGEQRLRVELLHTHPCFPSKICMQLRPLLLDRGACAESEDPDVVLTVLEGHVLRVVCGHTLASILASRSRGSGSSSFWLRQGRHVAAGSAAQWVRKDAHASAQCHHVDRKLWLRAVESMRRCVLTVRARNCVPIALSSKGRGHDAVGSCPHFACEPYGWET